MYREFHRRRISGVVLGGVEYAVAKARFLVEPMIHEAIQAFDRGGRQLAQTWQGVVGRR